MSETSILLETGTNEVEIIEFLSCGQTYGINVAKLREILIFDGKNVTPVVGGHPSILGLLELRNRTLPLVDLNEALKHGKPSENAVVLVCEFNGRAVGFTASGIRRIHRVSWEDLLPLNGYLMSHRPMLTGVVSIEERIVKVLDLEHLVARLFGEEQMAMLYKGPAQTGDGAQPAQHGDAPAGGLALSEDEEERTATETNRAKVVVLAEDSVLIRESLEAAFRGAGHKNIRAFGDGRAALEYIQKVCREQARKGKSITDVVNVLITDIEMPQMDGLTLCNKLKSASDTQHLLIVIFSSLIDEQLALKCEQVKADAYMVKPKIDRLLEIVHRVSDDAFRNDGDTALSMSESYTGG